MSLAEVLELERAFRRVQQDKRDDAWPDIVGYRDYRRELEGNLEQLRVRLATPGSYQASPPLGIDLPKKGFTLRPGTVPLLEDRLLYQAIADALSPHYAAECCVYSNRRCSDPDSRRMFLPGVGLWLEFQDRIEALCAEYAYVVETDIAAYFDHIGHDLLLHRIEDLFASRIDKRVLREMKQLLQRLLRRWSRGGHRFGIPQVNDASSFFANLYLDELDKWMLRHDYPYLRYVDDMRVFAADEPGARRALAELIVQLRSMGLYVASAKTAIRRTAEVLEELGEGRRRMTQIQEELNSGDAQRLEGAAVLVEQLFLELVGEPDRFDGRQFRYCVNRFKKLQASGLAAGIHGRVVDEVLARLASMPYSTDVFADYLSLFPGDSHVQDAVLSFLEGSYNVYPWQEMILLELLIRSDVCPEHSGRVLAVARASTDPSKHPACRGKAFVLWGKNGDYADRREIRAAYYDESREDVRRAILVALQEMQRGELDNFLQRITRHSGAILSTARYVQSLDRPIYHYYNPPAGYELQELYDDSDDLDDLSSEDLLY